MNPPGARVKQILVVDLIRFACAMLVLAYHYAAMMAVAAGGTVGETPTLWFGFVGVEVFFVISGYVIASSAAEGEGRAFLRRRMLRLAPAAWICGTATAGVVLASGLAAPAALLPQWLASMTFFPLAPQVDASYWTLGIELSFYLLVAALLDGRGNARRIEQVGLALAIASAAHWGWHGTAGPQLNRGIDLLLLSHGGFFAIGIALHAARVRGWTAARLATLAIGAAAGTAELATTSADIASGRGVQDGRWLPLAIVAAAIAAIAAADRLQRPLDRVIGARRLAMLGLMTYPLYLIHQRAGDAASYLLVDRGVPAPLATAVAALLSLIVAWAVVRHAEPRLRAWLARRWPVSPVRAPAPDTPRIAFPPAG